MPYCPAFRLVTLLLLSLSGLGAGAADKFILLQSTTSTQNSGLFDYLLPQYEALSGVEVRVIAVGTGQALKNAASGNGDVLMVHARKAEEQFIADGFGVKRYPVMYNEFVIIGPAADPAGIGAATKLTDALQRIAATKSLFVSRGDDSGTHKRELSLWQASSIKPDAAKDNWYKDTGSGMGRTISVAVELGAYTLTDQGTWISYGDRGDHSVLFAGDPQLFNQYSLILVNPKAHPHTKVEQGEAFIRWMLGERGQQAIGAFKLNGQQLFYPNAGSAD